MNKLFHKRYLNLATKKNIRNYQKFYFKIFHQVYCSAWFDNSISPTARKSNCPLQQPLHYSPIATSARIGFFFSQAQSPLLLPPEVLSHGGGTSCATLMETWNSSYVQPGQPLTLHQGTHTAKKGKH